MQHYADSMEKTIDAIPKETMRSLARHPWPGNICELQNYIARGVILSTHGLFLSAPPEKSEPLPPDISNPTLEDKVRKEIAPCERLGLKRTTLFYKMKRLGITPPSDNSQD